MSGECMKYEDEYTGPCWDFIWLDGYEPAYGFKSLSTTLVEEYGVEIANKLEFNERVRMMLEKMHEDGVIKPKVTA